MAKKCRFVSLIFTNPDSGFVWDRNVLFYQNKKTLSNTTKVVNVISVSLLLVSFYGIGEYIISEGNVFEKLGESYEDSQIQIANTESFPDIYYIILDGYAGSKSLEIILNYDNS